VAAAWGGFDGRCLLQPAVMGTSLVVLSCELASGARISLASVFCKLTASSPLHRTSLGGGCFLRAGGLGLCLKIHLLLGLPPTPVPSKGALGASFSSQLLCLSCFDCKISRQGSFDGDGRLLSCCSWGCCYFTHVFLLQLRSLCPSPYLHGSLKENFTYCLISLIFLP